MEISKENNPYMSKKFYDSLFHYTSLMTLDSIFFNAYNNVTLWVSRHDSTNDIIVFTTYIRNN